VILHVKKTHISFYMLKKSMTLKYRYQITFSKKWSPLFLHQYSSSLWYWQY
jgi:hypothetical protein